MKDLISFPSLSLVSQVFTCSATKIIHQLFRYTYPFLISGQLLIRFQIWGRSDEKHKIFPYMVIYNIWRRKCKFQNSFYLGKSYNLRPKGGLEAEILREARNFLPLLRGARIFLDPSKRGRDFSRSHVRGGRLNIDPGRARSPSWRLIMAL